LHRKEKKFKLQEAELREKDILIQDNLIKFSTFLQQQEMRKKKDLDATDSELKVSLIFIQKHPNIENWRLRARNCRKIASVRYIQRKGRKN
jgi:hypothetical protein